MLILLLLLGIFTYLIVRRSVANITRTPVWLLWLVMMTPAFIWTIWVALNGDSDVPVELLLIPFIVCPLLYWALIQWGRPVGKNLSSASKNSSADSSVTDPTAPGVNERAIAAINSGKPEVVRPIDKEEEAALKNCFPWSIYYLRDVEYRPQALICRGHLRTSPEVAYKTIRENIEKLFGNRFLIVFQEGLDGKPFFALVPNPQRQVAEKMPEQSSFRPGLAAGLLLITIVTTTLSGVMLSGVTSEELQGNLGLLVQGLPYGLALMAILAVHELGHYLTARRYRIKATLPYFIPVPPALNIFPFGTFGAFIQMRSPIPNRKALFDVGIAGPLSGFIVTVPILIWGLAHSTPTSLTEESGILNFESFNPSASFLIALLSKLALGGQLTPTSALDLHPVAIAGCLGVVITALNLMPVGQLDGGHIVHAMFGQRTGAMIGQIARFLVLALSFVQREFLVWAILLFFMPIADEPALNDVSELDNKRDFWGLVALTLLVIIVLPAPATMTRLLF
ncbi:MAG: site-2 protease family protein [Synechococcales bacterium]|nr:site-2 protease family protein [Synechococcales bacterium]